MDETALCEYIMENRMRFYRHAYRYTRNEEDAQDVLSEAVYKALRSYRKLRRAESIQSWFYCIVTRCAIDFLRKKKDFVALQEEVVASYELQCDDIIDLKTILKTLDEKQQTILALRFHEGLQLSEIAAVLDIPLNTAKTRLYSALRVVNHRLKGE